MPTALFLEYIFTVEILLRDRRNPLGAGTSDRQ